jgi:2-polyprenyl-6-hydroxyphenyl methylase/3-demethylubiquinone-9 3-methyltransferase
MNEISQRPVGEVLDAVGEIVRETGNAKDVGYFAEHRARYLRTLARIMAVAPAGGRALDVGSHFLHQTSALSLLGLEAHGMDVSVFSASDLAKSRAARHGIRNHAVDDFQSGAFLPGMDDAFDLVVFTEIMEHITFNPVLFWRRIYQILKTGGLIYVTTPNALTLWKILAVIKNALTLRGAGLPMHRILDTVTYGHHWKEYTGRELRDYFRMLSPDFDVDVSYFDLGSDAPPSRSPKAGAIRLVNSTAAIVPAFREQIEAVVRLPRKTGWTLEPPGFV